MKREVVIVQHGGNPIVGLLFVIILVAMFWKWVVVIIGSIAAVVLIGWLFHAISKDVREQAELDALRADAKKCRDEETKARADRQRNWYEQGDPRAVFGEEYEHGKELGD